MKKPKSNINQNLCLSFNFNGERFGFSIPLRKDTKFLKEDLTK